MSQKQTLHRFSATVRKVDINPYVKVPGEIIEKLQQSAHKEKGPIPVVGTLQGKPFSTTVVRFRGLWRLYLNTPMRRDAGVEVGDKVTIGLRFDATARTVPFPRAFKLALSKNKQARAAFQQLAPSRQKEILRYLNNLKQLETLERNIEKTIRFLQDKKAEGLVILRRTK
jgi:hypothetical protein